MNGPILDGSRFRLRPPRLDEAGQMSAWFEDMEVTAHTRFRYVPSPEFEAEWLRSRAGDPTWILWAIEHEGRLVGVSSIGDINWPNQRATTGTLIGDKRAWGKGIAGEMMKLRAEFAFTQTTLRKLISGYLVGNEASRRAQQAAGYRQAALERQHYFRDGRWQDHVITELLREDWERERA